MDSNEEALIFNIQKFCVHDGPGIRTIVFFKGCPLVCKWCANPEGIEMYPQIALKVNKCIGISKCGFCITNCPEKAISTEQDKPYIDRSKCINCSKCQETCYAKALELLGRSMSVEEIIKKVEEDNAFYMRSGGGITLSGGEPLMQAKFAVKLLTAAKKEGLETAIETSGFAPWEKAKPVFEKLDYIQYDLKSMDTKKHKEYTGVPNQLILDNFRKLCAAFPEKQIMARTPVIPGFNDTVKEIQAIADFISEAAQGHPNIRYELLPFHAFGSAKYEYLGGKYPFYGQKNMDKAFVNAIKDNLNTTIEIT